METIEVPAGDLSCMDAGFRFALRPPVHQVGRRPGVPEDRGYSGMLVDLNSTSTKANS